MLLNRVGAAGDRQNDRILGPEQREHTESDFIDLSFLQLRRDFREWMEAAGEDFDFLGASRLIHYSPPELPLKPNLLPMVHLAF